jgi:hypothetical protein
VVFLFFQSLPFLFQFLCLLLIKLSLSLFRNLLLSPNIFLPRLLLGLILLDDLLYLVLLHHRMLEELVSFLLSAGLKLSSFLFHFHLPILELFPLSLNRSFSSIFGLFDFSLSLLSLSFSLLLSLRLLFDHEFSSLAVSLLELLLTSIHCSLLLGQDVLCLFGELFLLDSLLLLFLNSFLLP